MTPDLDSLELKAPHDASGASWIEGCLKGSAGEVTQSIPSIFEAYARVFHPASTPEGSPRRWEEVATELRRKMHPLVQWHALVGLASPDDLPSPEWPGSPEVGVLSPEVLRPLLDVLARHTDHPEECFFGFWTGWSAAKTIATRTESVAEHRNPWVDYEGTEHLSGPQFSLPRNAGRDYALRVGPIRAAVAVAEMDPLLLWSPNYIWPSDRAWFLATDIDFDSTLVGGSERLIDELLNADRLEVRRLNPNDSIAFDADRLNRS